MTALLRRFTRILGHVPKPTTFSRVQTGMLFVSTAALGGVALALWNRRALAKLREHADESSQEIGLDISEG